MKLLLTALAFLSLRPAFSQDYTNEIPYTFEKSEEYYLLADSVNVRKTAQVNGELVAVLPIGTKVKILSQSATFTKLNNYNMHWYEVQFNGKQTGFVWGGKIAKTSFRSTKNTSIVFHFGIDAVKMVDGSEEVFYQIRVQQNGRQLQKISCRGFGYALKMHTLTNQGNKGLTSVDDILYLEGFSEACGDSGGSIVLMHSGGKLTEAIRLNYFADVPVFSHDLLYFPSDMEGKKDRVVFLHESGEWIEGETEGDEGYVNYDEQKTVIYQWDGSKLIEVNR